MRLRLLIILLAFTVASRAQTAYKISVGAGIATTGFLFYKSMTYESPTPSRVGPQPWGAMTIGAGYLTTSLVTIHQATSDNLTACIDPMIVDDPEPVPGPVPGWKEWIPNWKQCVLSVATGAIDGWIQGQEHALLFHPDVWYSRHPHRDPDWWYMPNYNNPTSKWFMVHGQFTYLQDFPHWGSQTRTINQGLGIGLTLLINRKGFPSLRYALKQGISTTILTVASHWTVRAIDWARYSR